MALRRKIRYQIEELVELDGIRFGSRVGCAEFIGQLEISKFPILSCGNGSDLGRVQVNWTPGRSMKFNDRL
jgi:hypothetical protein